jgi:hypothetical protein
VFSPWNSGAKRLAHGILWAHAVVSIMCTETVDEEARNRTSLMAMVGVDRARHGLLFLACSRAKVYGPGARRQRAHVASVLGATGARLVWLGAYVRCGRIHWSKRSDKLGPAHCLLRAPSSQHNFVSFIHVIDTNS